MGRAKQRAVTAAVMKLKHELGTHILRERAWTFVCKVLDLQKQRGTGDQERGVRTMHL